MKKISLYILVMTFLTGHAFALICPQNIVLYPKPDKTGKTIVFQNADDSQYSNEAKFNQLTLPLCDSSSQAGCDRYTFQGMELNTAGIQNKCLYTGQDNGMSLTYSSTLNKFSPSTGGNWNGNNCNSTSAASCSFKISSFMHRIFS